MENLFGMPIIVNPDLRDDILFGLVSRERAAALMKDGRILLGKGATSLTDKRALLIPPVD